MKPQNPPSQLATSDHWACIVMLTRIRACSELRNQVSQSLDHVLKSSVPFKDSSQLRFYVIRQSGRKNLNGSVVS